MADKIKASELLEHCKKNGVSLSDEHIKKINDFGELGKEELKNVAGGCPDPIPDSPPCKKCGSTDTWTEFCPPFWYMVHCRTCNAEYKEKITD